MSEVLSPALIMFAAGFGILLAGGLYLTVATHNRFYASISLLAFFIGPLAVTRYWDHLPFSLLHIALLTIALGVWSSLVLIWCIHLHGCGLRK